MNSQELKISPIEELVFSMLTENTGRHFLDSGDAYGRNWERNALKELRDFRRQPLDEYTVHNLTQENTSLDGQPHSVWIERTVHVFPFLTEGGLELDDLCDKFNALTDDDWSDDSQFYGVTNKQHELLSSLDVTEVHGFNTYNGDSDLSQVLQGSWIRIDDEPYLILQIHGGCDVRGGYTTARLFKPHEEYFMHEYCRDWQDSSEVLEELVEYNREFYCDDTKTLKTFDNLSTQEQENLQS